MGVGKELVGKEYASLRLISTAPISDNATNPPVQGGPSGHGKPPVDLVLTVLAASGPLL